MNIKTTQESSTMTYGVGENQNKENSTKLITNEPIEGTPFRMIGNEDLGYFIACGMHRLTEPLPTIIETYELLESDKWNILVRTIVAINETLNNERNNISNEKIHTGTNKNGNNRKTK